VAAIEVPEPHTVVFRLNRPRPWLLLMVASGYSPINLAHLPIATLRQRCVGTGPFRQKECLRDQLLELERNPDHFVPGWRIEYFARWPHVKDLVPHNSLYHYGRMQEVWLDR
jgi:MarR-like DNA-binding transcriptional regulator SgrR of sgrS sRNA